ncbi:cysteine-rich receptor-like protein kinase 5 isoform X1 [Prunus yedoensis var. nudiflora]|uniref:Cysteine-rich receptor-like protein kinase 5 isoform X1 n=1 Tax=Prunus yedoensis var. nudiflora TaxID=2094558 RepID=A0A314ZDS8_PRUYE|nr:cysteine-rich receptor-like protein kinase 5 isoform X1 [Prunus yedoensis var. nudiflora]
MVFKFSSVLLVLLFFHILVAFRLQASEVQSWIKAAYWYSGSELPIADINSALFTHLFAFADLNSSSYELSSPPLTLRRRIRSSTTPPSHPRSSKRTHQSPPSSPLGVEMQTTQSFQHLSAILLTERPSLILQ